MPMLRSMVSTSVRCTGEMPWWRGSTRSSGPTPISGTISSAASDSRQAAVDAVARMSGERWLAERPPASGR